MVFDAPPFVCPGTREELFAMQATARAWLRELLGSPPFGEKPPLEPRILYTADCGSYWRRKVRYGSETDDVVWAWLLVPKRASRPLPAVICLAGSFMTPNYGRDGPAGLAGPENRGDPEAYGADFARLGYVALCPDYPAAGERTSPGRRSHDTTELDARFPSWSRVGLSAWDVSRAVDFLLTVPEADAARIGCTGWSQGGQMTLLGAALEPRIAAIAPVCGWSPLRGLAGDIADNLAMPYNYPRLKPRLEGGRSLTSDLDHIAACIAPRPFLNLDAAEDQYFPNRDETRRAEAEIARTYGLLGVPERFRAFWAEGGHAFGSDAARETQAWFYRFLWSA